MIPPRNNKKLSTISITITLIFVVTLECNVRLTLAKNSKLQHQAITVGAIKNGVTNGDDMHPITLQGVHNWAGRFVINASTQIEQLLPSAFLHEGVARHPKGSKSALVYTQRSKDPLKGVVHTWVLAWPIPTFPSVYNQNQVYVAAGGIIPRTEKGDIDWESIERRLDSSSDTTDSYDNISQTEAIAVITYSGNHAALSAVFS